MRLDSRGHELRMLDAERVHDLVVLLRLAGTGGVDERTTWTQDGGAIAQHMALLRREDRKILRGAAPADIRIPPDRAQTRAWRVEKDAIENRTERQRPRDICLHQLHPARATALHRASQQRDAPSADVAGDDASTFVEARCHRDGLSARRRAG